MTSLLHRAFRFYLASSRSIFVVQELAANEGQKFKNPAILQHFAAAILDLKKKSYILSHLLSAVVLRVAVAGPQLGPTI